MKVFYLSAFLLLALIAAVIGNAIYINNVVETMLTQVQSLPDIRQEDCVFRITELLAYWEANTDRVYLSVGFLSVDRITEQSKLLLSCAECGNNCGFSDAKALLTDALCDIKRLEEVHIGNLF